MKEYFLKITIEVHYVRIAKNQPTAFMESTSLNLKNN